MATIAELIANRLGFQIEKFLGCGFFGQAHLLIDGRVMKITNCEQEYAMSLTLMRTNCKHIVKIHDVFTVKCSLNTYYVVIRDYLTSSENFGSTGNMIWGILANFSRVYDNKVFLCETVEELWLLQGKYPHLKDFIEQAWAMLEECKSLGWKWCDFKENNIGIKDGILQLFDTGCSGLYTEESYNVVELEENSVLW